MKGKKTRVAALSVISNTTLVILKAVVGIFTGSVSIVSEAIHSAMDLVAALIAYISVSISDNPPDKDHPYGHGKIENVSGVIEALLIFIAAVWIIIEAVNKLLHKSPVESLGLGIGVMAFSALVNAFVSHRLYKTARETDSVALEADALHLKTDIYTSLGVGAGLGLMALTGIPVLDPLIAIGVAMLILWEAYRLLRKAFSPLLDSSLGEEDVELIRQVLLESKLKAHQIRTRKSGHHKFADMHLELPPDWTLEKVHQTCDMLEEKLRKALPGLHIHIHVEPNGIHKTGK